MAMTANEYPLSDTWRFTVDEYFANQRDIYTFSTVGDFWRMFNNILPVSKLPHKYNYRCFRANSSSESEHPSNFHGGQWIMTTATRGQLPKVWLYSLLDVLGGSLPHVDLVNGIVVSVRHRGDRVALWLQSADDMDRVMEIGHALKTQFPLLAGIEFKRHQDAVNFSATTAKSVVVLGKCAQV